MEKRFWQLHEVQKETAHAGWSYLTAVNGGGAVAVLGYLGAVPSARDQTLPYAVLAVFMVAVVLVGCGRAFLAVSANALLKNWNQDSLAYRLNNVPWSKLIADDMARVNRLSWVPWAMAWTSFGLFIIGAVLSALTFRL